MRNNVDGTESAQGTESLKPESTGNRLVFEKSPYLLQHAGNPVDWYPWGTEAFEKARAEDKPVFLSIGYSTCHWCHVMEHESFENEETAALMNETFVSIKVDREERPDIDHMYMTVAQMMTGRGGWPLNVVMTPDKRPFFAGTYFPKDSRFGRIGLDDLCRRIRELWIARRDEVLESAAKVLTALKQVPDERPGDAPDKSVLEAAYRQLSQRFDPRLGGFGEAPKFPTPHNLSFLLRYWKRTGEANALAMVEKTLQAMRSGGIYDHVGFGFHRYSTDAEWLVPHFEKMLYDQAMLAMAYLETYQATGKERYARTAEEIFTYVLRDMTSPQGGFYSAEDADSEGEEGKFYVWDPEEIRTILDDREAAVVMEAFTMIPGGNFREEATGRMTGLNIPHMRKSMDRVAGTLGIPEDQAREVLERARLKLFEAREARIHPHKDDKILTDWNGLMIAALSKGSRVFDNRSYAQAASKAADFVLGTLRNRGGRLLHRYRDGEAGLPAHVDDYAFLIWGLLELYEATFDVSRLRAAVDLNTDFIERFWDPGLGGFFFTADDSEELLVRKKEIYDGAVPSGNSVAALNLLRLGRITARPDFEEKADRIGRVFSGTVKEFPSAFTHLMTAMEFALGPSHEVVISGNPDAADARIMVSRLCRPFLPNTVVLFRPTGHEKPEITSIAPYTEGLTAIEGKAAAYVCRDYNCELPTTDPDTMLELLHRP
ncbi:MAG: thioredoxin domain-containing protein [Pseudomonadota bacterium]